MALLCHHTLSLNLTNLCVLYLKLNKISAISKNTPQKNLTPENPSYEIKLAYLVEKTAIYIDFYTKMTDAGVVYWYLNGKAKEGGKPREIAWFWIWCSHYIYIAQKYAPKNDRFLRSCTIRTLQNHDWEKW